MQLVLQFLTGPFDRMHSVSSLRMHADIHLCWPCRPLHNLGPQGCAWLFPAGLMLTAAGLDNITALDLAIS